MTGRSLAVLAFGLFSTATLAQQPAGPAVPAPPPRTTFGMHSGRVADCLQSEVDRKLKGNDLIDDRQICFAVARLDCVKLAVANKLYGTARNDFLKTCIGT